MSDFLGRLADRSLGVAKVARPILPSAYAPQREPDSRGIVEMREFIDDERPSGDVDRRGVAATPHPAEEAIATLSSPDVRPGAAGPRAGPGSDRPVRARAAAHTDATGPASARGPAAAARMATPPADKARPAATRRDGGVEAPAAIPAAVPPTPARLGPHRRIGPRSVDSAVPVAPLGTRPAGADLLLPATHDVGAPQPPAEATVLSRLTPSPIRRTHGARVVETADPGTSMPANSGAATRRRLAGEATPGDTAPTITVTIGRVEVRSPAPPVPRQPATPPWKPPHLSLDEFLARRPGR